MRSRLDHLPVFESRTATIRAEDYNLVKIALKRLGSPLRFEIPNLHTLDFIFENDAWIIVDRRLDDIPIIAWLNFDIKNRAGLHEPVECECRTYRAQALIIVDKSFEAMHLMLGEQLAAATPESESTVVQIKTPGAKGEGAHSEP